MAYSHIIGIDDAPFARSERGEVLVVGAVYAGSRLEGVLSTGVMRDGSDATATLRELIGTSRFFEHLQLVMLQGITLAGFNVVDVRCLSRKLSRPALVVMRREPDFEAIREALLQHVPGGEAKWALIERQPPVEPLGSVYVQRAGLLLEEAEAVLAATALHGHIPEPLRTAHLVAGGVVTGESRGRV